MNASRGFRSVSFINVVSGVSDQKYRYQLFNTTIRHPTSLTYTYLWPIQLLIDMRRNMGLLGTPFTRTRQNLTRESEVGKQSDFFFRKVARFVSLSMPFNQQCGAIYLRSKSYLVFKISSDIMTKHCCQVCVLSMTFYRSDARLC